MKICLSLTDIIIFLVLLPGLSISSFATPLSSMQIIMMMEEQDPVSVVRQLHKVNHGESWYNALSKIKTGSPDWLNLPQWLEKGTGTRGAEQLMDAVTRAIPHNPSGVLQILNEKNIYLNTVNICSLPLIPVTPSADLTFKNTALTAMMAQLDGTVCAKAMQEAMYGSHTLPGNTKQQQ